LHPVQILNTTTPCMLQATHMHGRSCGEVEFFHHPFPYILECPDNGSQDHMKHHEVTKTSRLVIDCFSDA
jgi:hypothetical protein